MPGLSVTEKQHRLDRIAARIELAAEKIRAAHPALFDRVRREAHAEALSSLNLAGPYAELEAVRAAEAELCRRKKQAQRAMIAALRGIPIDEVPDSINARFGPELPLPYEAAEAIARRQAAHQGRLLADDPIGLEIARLEAEKDGLLDTVWLACSPAQIKQLWAKVMELLGDEPTALGREALAIAPAGGAWCPGDNRIDGGDAPAGARRADTGASGAPAAPRASRAPGPVRSTDGCCRGWRGPRSGGISMRSA